MDGAGELRAAILNSCTDYQDKFGNNIGEFSYNPIDPSKITEFQHVYLDNHPPEFFVFELNSCANLVSEFVWADIKFCGGTYSSLPDSCGGFPKGPVLYPIIYEKAYRDCQCDGSDKILKFFLPMSRGWKEDKWEWEE